MSKRLRYILMFLGLFIILGIGTLVYFFKTRDIPVDESKPAVTEFLDTIKDYNYNLEKRDGELFKTKFNELKDELSKTEIDFEKYAELLSELYIIDLYTINNKLNLYDVGSKEFINPDNLENFELKVKDTIYKYVEDNSSGKREQSLPEVKSIELSNVKTTKFKLDNTNYDAYEVVLTWDYEEDLEYDTKATITAIKIDNKLYIVEQK